MSFPDLTVLTIAFGVLYFAVRQRRKEKVAPPDPTMAPGSANHMALPARALLWSAHAKNKKTTLKAVMEHYSRGDYQAALQAAEGFRSQGQVTDSYCFYRGSILALLGRLQEADPWLRQSLTMRKASHHERLFTISLTVLGQLMLEAGRYDEARSCFEESIRHFPERGADYRSMAEWHLVCRNSPAEAVRWAELAIEKNRTDCISSELRRLYLYESVATLAWAVAADSHDASEVTQLVTEAISGVGDSNVEATALVQYQAGCAFKEIGDLQAGTRHFEEAARIDPQGRWGRAACAALQSSAQLKPT